MDKLTTRNDAIDMLGKVEGLLRDLGSTEAAGLVNAAIRSASYDRMIDLATKYGPSALASQKKGDGADG